MERRARFNLAKAEKRLHLVAGFLAALTDLDRIVKLIRAADDGEQQPAVVLLLLRYVMSRDELVQTFLPSTST